jgi:hypothetical protein
MSFAEFTNNKNKGVLWGILQEGGVFNNIPSSMFHNVKNIFEMSILSMKQEFDLFFDKNDEGDDDYDKKAADMIINSNKIVIKKVIDEVNKIKIHNENSMKQAQAQAQAQSQSHSHSQPQQNMRPVPSQPMLPPIATSSTKKSKIEEIYRADDIKNTRMSELEIRLKEKQAEMDTMLNNKKPEHIDFSDKALGINKDSDLYDKKLAGDEMERLLAEALASRERELDKLNIDADRGSGSGSGSDHGIGGVVEGSEGSDSRRIPTNKIVAKRPRESKNVTFNDADNTKVEYEKQDYDKTDSIVESGEGGESGEVGDTNTLSFFSKLKTKKDNSVENTKSMDKIRIPLDDIMNMANRSDDENENHNEGMQLRVQEMHNFGGSKNREWGEVRETREWGEMREMQKYVVLEQRIQGIQNDMNEIKRNQELILSILEKKVH